MNAYLDYDKRIMITDIICNRTPITYEILKQLEADNRLEDGDLFSVERKATGFDIAILYLDKKFYAIDGENKMHEMTDAHLKYRRFLIDNIMYESPYQEFIKKRSKEEFDALSEDEKIDVYLGNYFTKHINETLDGLKNTFKDIIDILKEEKEKENANSKKN